MIGLSTNTNSIYIPILPTGCCKTEFDSSYPIHLNGIISQEEFQQSIRNINRAVSTNKAALIIYTSIFIVMITSATICFIVAGATATTSFRNRFYTLMVIGIILSVISSLVFSIGMYLVHSKRMTRVRQVIAEESAKYSSRSPVPCSWRLNILSGWNRGFGYQRNGQSAYSLVVDIGHVVAGNNGSAVYYSNQNVFNPSAPSGQRNDYTLPPYPAQSPMGFCSRCGTARQDLTTKVCLSCEQTFNNF